MKDLISVIVPIYNMERCLKKCLDSIVSQTYRNLEIILINDGSTDRSAEICDNYAEHDPRIRVLHKANGGLFDARNKGLNLATGDYIGFVDSDDYIEKVMYESLHSVMVEHDADIAMSSVYHVKNGVTSAESDSGKIEVLSRDGALIGLLIDEKIRSYMCNKLYRARLFEGIEFPIVSIMEDVHTNFQLFKKIDTLVYLDSPLYHYVFWPGSISRGSTQKKNEDAYRIVLDRYLDIQKNFPHLEKYNGYALVIWMTRTYFFINQVKDSDDAFFRKDYALFKENLFKHRRYILEKISPNKKEIVFRMFSEYDTDPNIMNKLLEESDPTRGENALHLP